MNDIKIESDFATSAIGRPFVHPLFDYMLIGGGLSLLMTAVLVATPGAAWRRPEFVVLPMIILLSNSAHFAASSLRLYTKPGSFQDLPFLTMIFPLVAVAVLAVGLAYPAGLGPHLQALYLTWSPFHYAAQAYGLAVLYSYRSGCNLALGDKKLLWWVSMLPFIYTLVNGRRTGLGWLLPDSVQNLLHLPTWRGSVEHLLMWLAFLGIVLLIAKIWKSSSGPMPVISILVLVSNGIWWFVLSPINAFIWATVFHGLQYLAIVVVFHVKDQMELPTNRHGPTYHVLWFYGICIVLGYALFQCLPLGFVVLGFGFMESLMLVAAVINIHHFIVDAYIWRLKNTDSNRKIVEGPGLLATSPA